MKIFAVAGCPVLHSKSPEMFNAAFASLLMDAVYVRFSPSKAEEITRAAREIGLAGLNITSPFKEAIIPFLDHVDDAAKKVGAVNTVLLREGRLEGYNTDIAGVRDAFLRNGVVLRGKKAAVIGAGGAARAAVFALLSEGSDVTVINRTVAKAQKIAGDLGCRASGFDRMEEELQDAGVIVSCLPAGVKLALPSLRGRDIAVLDASYSAPTLPVEKGETEGCRIIDGKEWLLFQGTRAFQYLTGAEPPVSVMRRALYMKKPARKKNIALVGFMGAGKSAVARDVSLKTNMPVVEVDDEIEASAGSSVRDIFENRGECAFRVMEKEEISKVRTVSGKVISCGGGAVLSRANRVILKRNCIVVWLWAGIDTVLKRVGDNGTRPLLNVRDKKARIKKMLDARLPSYASVSDFIVRTDEREPGEIAGKVYDESSRIFRN